MPTTSFTQLKVWKAAHQNVLAIYRLTKTFPIDERFELSPQMRRAAVSVPANIAEGYGRRGPNDKTRFYNIAQASAEELKYYLILSKDLGYLKDLGELWAPMEEVCRMLHGLVEAIRRPPLDA